MGGIGDMMKMLPGMAGKVKSEDIDEDKLMRAKVIIQSMTVKERRNPDIIKGSRRKRIAQGSGTSIQEVNQLLKQFELTREMMFAHAERRNERAARHEGDERAVLSPRRI